MTSIADFDVISGVLSADVATSGTFTTGWFAGARLGDYRSGKSHYLSNGGKVYSAPVDFTVAYTSATVITITWLGTNTLKAGSSFRLQLDRGGSLGGPDGVNNACFLRAIRVNLGAPIVSADNTVRANAALATTGSFALIAAGQTFPHPRNVIITSSGNDTGVTFTVTGKDEYGATVVEAITGANAGVAAGKKAFKSITTIANDVAAAANVKVGFGNVLGLPVHTSATSILKELQDGAAATAGTLVAGLSVLTKPTATTADVRGTYVPNATPDGAKVFELDLELADPTFLGSPQFAG